MAIRQADGSIKLKDGRVIFANSLVLAQDLCEIIPLCVPPPAWPLARGGGGAGGFVASGGGGSGVVGRDGVQGTQGPASPFGGPQGSQGFQGVGGQGAQGPQGNQGNVGPQGTGLQGSQGNQGNQGVAATGAQGPQGLLSPDIFAATRVVSLIAGDGTDLTIAAAIAALPAAGGGIYVKQGTYPFAATQMMPDKPVVIRGAGDGTIIDIGANAIPAFTIPTGLTALRRYVFEDFKVTGTAVVDQKVWSIQDVNSRGQAFITRVNSSGIQYILDVTAGDTTLAASVEVEMDSCHFIPTDISISDISALVKIPDVTAFNVLLRMAKVDYQTSDDDATDFGAIRNASATATTKGLDIIAVDCHFTNSYKISPIPVVLGGVQFTNCFIKDLQVTTGVIKTLDIKGSYRAGFKNALTNVVARRQQIAIAPVGGTVLGGKYIDSSIDLQGTGEAVGVEFIGGTYQSFSLNLGDKSRAGDCRFESGNDAGATGLTVLGNACIINNCLFDFFDVAGEKAAIWLEAVNYTIISDCTFRDGDPAVPSILEDSANFSKIDNNVFLIGAPQPTIVGASTTVNEGNIRTVSANTVLDENYKTVNVNATGGARTITLPTALSFKYQIFTIKKTDASGNAVTVDGNGAETIDGALTQVLAAQWDSIIIQSSGTAWFILAKNP